MLHAGLDLSRNRLDVCLLSEQGEIVEEFKSPADLAAAWLPLWLPPPTCEQPSSTR